MRQIKKDSTDISVDVYIIDSADGTPETGVVFDTSGIDLEFRRQGAAVVNITEADLTSPALTDAHADGGFLAIGHGLYRLDVPDAAFATGVETVSIQGTVTGMIVLPQTIQLVDFDPQDAVRLGLTALPNAAADGAFGLPISDAGGLDMDGIVLSGPTKTEMDTAHALLATPTQVATELGTYGGPTKTEMDTAHGLLATPTQVNTEVDNALDTALPGSPTGGSMNEVVKRLGRSVGVVQEYTIDNTSFTATTTQAQVDAVDIGSLEATDDHFNGRIIIFTSGVNIHQATDITDYDGTNKRFTYTAVTDTPEDDATFIVI